MINDIYPKYRVVRKYDIFIIETQSFPCTTWVPYSTMAHAFGPAAKRSYEYSSESEAVKMAKQLVKEAELKHKRKTDVEVVWASEP